MPGEHERHHSQTRACIQRDTWAGACQRIRGYFPREEFGHEETPDLCAGVSSVSGREFPSPPSPGVLLPLFALPDVQRGSSDHQARALIRPLRSERYPSFLRHLANPPGRSLDLPRHFRRGQSFGHPLPLPLLTRPRPGPQRRPGCHFPTRASPLASSRPAWTRRRSPGPRRILGGPLPTYGPGPGRKPAGTC